MNLRTIIQKIIFHLWMMMLFFSLILSCNTLPLFLSLLFLFSLSWLFSLSLPLVEDGVGLDVRCPQRRWQGGGHHRWVEQQWKPRCRSRCGRAVGNLLALLALRRCLRGPRLRHHRWREGQEWQFVDGNRLRLRRLGVAELELEWRARE